MLCEGIGTCLELRPIFSALAITSEGIAIIPMVAIALGLPAGQPVHVNICCTEAHSNVALPALADYLHFKIVDWERRRYKNVRSNACCILIGTARACSCRPSWSIGSIRRGHARHDSSHERRQKDT